MDIRTIILALVLVGTLLLFGVAFLGASFGEELQSPPIGVPEATRIILTEFPNARILEIELDHEHGRLVYEVELITAEGQKKEVHVNATTGRIEKIEHD